MNSFIIIKTIKVETTSNFFVKKGIIIMIIIIIIILFIITVSVSNQIFLSQRVTVSFQFL